MCFVAVYMYPCNESVSIDVFSPEIGEGVIESLENKYALL